MVAPVARALPRGERNRNPGNIERIKGVRWQGQSADQSGDHRFVVFDDPKWGIRAIARTLITYQDKRQAADGSKIDTIAEIISRWAPAVENNTGAYVAQVAKLTNIGATRAIDVYDWGTMKALVKAIITHENGRQPYDDATIDAGLIAAGLQPPAPKTRPSLSTAATGAIAAGGAIVASLPAAKEAHDQAVAAAGPLMVIVPWLPPVLGLIAFAAVIIVAARNLKLSRLAGG